MNKKIKRIIAFVLTISAFSAIEPAKNFNLLNSKVYAATGDITGISSLKVCKSSGSSAITMYKKSGYKNSTKFKDDIFKYYIELSENTSKFNIRASVDSGYTVKVIDESDDDEEYDLEDEISIKKGKTKTITVEIIKNEDSSKQTITLKVYRQDEDDEDDEDQGDDVYLKSISLSNGKISFSKTTYTYDINVEEDMDESTIAAKPNCDKDEYDNYVVRINGKRVDEDDKFKETVDLKKGKNEIKIIVEDDDDNIRTYTLNIIRGRTTNSNNSSNEGSINTTIVKSQWIKTNGMWQYKDAWGNNVTNTWLQNYFLQADGNMATGWLNYGQNWYYLGTDGAKKIGWQSVDGKWYYLDTAEGRMQTGWMRDITGKYYYLNSDGSMAYNTTIDGYKLGTNGDWTGR